MIFDELDQYSDKGIVIDLPDSAAAKFKSDYTKSSSGQRIYMSVATFMMDLQEAVKVLQTYGRCHCCELRANQVGATCILFKGITYSSSWLHSSDMS